MYNITIHYNHDCEAVYEFDYDYMEYFKNLNIEYSSLFSSPFHFGVGEDGWDVSVALVDQWMKGFKSKKGLYKECRTIEEAFRISRVNIIKKLLSDKTYTKEQLGLEDCL